MIVASAVSTSTVVLVGAVFLASTVEMVEALTIVLAVGHTRGWRSALEGAGAALGVLGVLVVGVGPALVRIPLSALRLGVGAVLLIFGLQWLRKAVLRAAGLKALHDEDEIYRETVAEMKAVEGRVDRDRVGFTMAFKGVFLEGLEVVVAVLTLGASAHRLALAATTAVVATLIVAVVGMIVARQLSNVPENLMKMSVGVMLVSFGTFWTGEALRVRWPGADAFLVALVVFYAAVVSLTVGSLRREGAGALGVSS